MCVCVCVLFRATPAAYRGSQARGPIRATASGLHHSHSSLALKKKKKKVSKLLLLGKKQAVRELLNVSWGCMHYLCTPQRKLLETHYVKFTHVGYLPGFSS